MPTDVIETLKFQRSRAAEDFTALAVALATDQQVDAGRASEVLAACGKRPEDLEAEVRRLKRIAQLEGQISKLEGIEAGGVELQRKRTLQVEEQKQELAALKAKHDQQDSAYADSIAPISMARAERVSLTAELAALRRAADPAPAAPSGTAVPFAGSRFIDYRGSNVINRQPNG